jgi:hypothetical protein
LGEHRGIKEWFPDSALWIHEDELLLIWARCHPVPETASAASDPLRLDRGSENRVFGFLRQPQGSLVILT